MANKTSASPPLFKDVGKRAKDLLQKGFSAGHMLFISFVTAGGATMSTTSIMAKDAVLGTITSSFKNAGVKTELSATTLDQITAETTYEDLVPGLKLSLFTTIPDAINLGKAELIYQRDFSAITATMKGWKTTPTIECSANFGSENLCLGGTFNCDTQHNLLSNTVAGLGYTSPQTSVAVLCNPKESVSAYCSYAVNPSLSWGIHVEHQFTEKISRTTFGGSWKIDPLTTVKARVNNNGVTSALLEFEPKPLITIGLSAEVNCMALKDERPNIGLSMSVLSI